MTCRCPPLPERQSDLPDRQFDSVYCPRYGRCMPGAWVQHCRTSAAHREVFTREATAGKYDDDRFQTCRDRGLGDTLARAFAATRRLWARLRRRESPEPEHCETCQRRQLWLNRVVSYRLFRKLTRIISE